jgi:hypothetical protein
MIDQTTRNFAILAAVKCRQFDDIGPHRLRRFESLACTIAIRARI